jgi:hypothetical protein
MKNRVIIAGVLMATCALTTVAGERRISVEEYRDKMADGPLFALAHKGFRPVFKVER